MNQKSISCYSAAARRECTRLLHINRLFFTAFIMIASAVTFFSCNHSPEATGTVTITVKGDQGVTVHDPKPIPVSKGTKWADLKNRVKVTVKPDYELDSWKLGSATGTGITDTTVFTSDTTVFAVSKKKGGGGNSPATRRNPVIKKRNLVIHISPASRINRSSRSSQDNQISRSSRSSRNSRRNLR